MPPMAVLTDATTTSCLHCDFFSSSASRERCSCFSTAQCAIGRTAAHHTPFQVRRSDCIRISKLEAQGAKSIFGGGLLLSERAAAERAAAERAAAHKWELSERERAMVHALSKPVD